MMPKLKVKKILVDQAQLGIVVGYLIDNSQFFRVMPFPDNVYEVMVRPEMLGRVSRLLLDEEEVVRQTWLNRAKDRWHSGSSADDDIEFDADARVSVSSDGAFVAAWLWVRKPDDEAEAEGVE